MGAMKKLMPEWDESFVDWMEQLGVETPWDSEHAWVTDDECKKFYGKEGVRMLKKMWDKLKGAPDNTIKIVKLSSFIIDGENDPVKIKYIKQNGTICDYTVRPLV